MLNFTQSMTREELEQIGKVIVTKLEAEREHSKQLIEASEKRVIKKIDESQEDTIGALTAIIEAGYALHNKRIERLEVTATTP